MKTANSNRTSASIKKQRMAERRRILLILITIILIIFSLGTLFGCFIGVAFASETSSAAGDYNLVKAVTKPPEIFDEPEQPLPVIESEGRVLDTGLQTAMLDMCSKYDLPFALALAVAEQESRFNPDAISITNDYGIMQINEINFGWLREQGIEPLDYAGNIEAGVLILSEAVKKHGDYGLALMAYNCGDAGAEKLWDKGIYSTEYSRSTMKRFEKWNSLLGGI